MMQAELGRWFKHRSDGVMIDIGLRVEAAPNRPDMYTVHIGVLTTPPTFYTYGPYLSEASAGFHVRGRIKELQMAGGEG